MGPHLLLLAFFPLPNELHKKPGPLQIVSESLALHQLILVDILLVFQSARSGV